MRAALDDPIMAGFVARLAEINALADVSLGLSGYCRRTMGMRPALGRTMTTGLFSTSVWDSNKSLRHHVFKTAHAELFRNRQAWFEKFGGACAARSWVPAGHVPTIDEAKGRLAHLGAHGPSGV